jgi:hypothetical protein
MAISLKNLDYQGLVTAYEKAKELYKAAKVKKKTLKTLFKASKEEDETTKLIISPTLFDYEQARLEEESNKIVAYIAKVNLKKYIKAFEERRKKKDKPKIEGIETLLFRYKYGKQFEKKLKTDTTKDVATKKTVDINEKVKEDAAVSKKIA